MKETYFVRPGLVLHKKNYVNARLTTQIYQDGDSIDLDAKEAIAYKHLIEDKLQKESREKITPKTK